MGLNPDQVEGILRRLQKWNVRLILGLAAALRRPLVKIWVIEDSGRILGVTMLSFAPHIAQVGGLTVDAANRRRGLAQALMNACERMGRKYRRSYLVLDVLSSNTPAIRLYERLGYRTIRGVRWMVRDLTSPLADPTPNRPSRLRTFRPGDAEELVRIANAAMPPSVQPMVRYRAQDFRGAGLSRRAGRVQATSWVVERDGTIVGYAKAFVSPAVEAAQIEPLVVGGPPATDVCEDLIRTALVWCAERRSPRVILALPEHLDALRPTLERFGFTESFRLHTMALDLGATSFPE